jgi:hypothetical protein
LCCVNDDSYTTVIWQRKEQPAHSTSRKEIADSEGKANVLKTSDQQAGNYKQTSCEQICDLNIYIYKVLPGNWTRTKN